MASARKNMSDVFMVCYEPDLVGSQFIKRTGNTEYRLGRDGCQYQLIMDDHGTFTAAYRQLTRKEAAEWGFAK